jgi:hypothetical protein
MTAPRSFDNRLDAFLDEGQTDLPDRAFDAVRRDIHTTRQRVVIGPWKEPTISTVSKLAMAAAIVAAVALAWATWPGKGDVGGPTPSPSITPAPVALTGGILALAPGRYRIDYAKVPGSDNLPGPAVYLTIPADGWTSYETFAVDRNYGTTAETAGASFVVWNITNVDMDPCTDHTPRGAVPGPGIDELLEALADQPGLEAGPITDVTVDGYSGKFVELTVATDITTCTDGFHPWVDKFVQGNNEVLRVYALDVEGTRFTFFARIPARTTAEHLAELESVIASVDIAP